MPNAIKWEKSGSAIRTVIGEFRLYMWKDDVVGWVYAVRGQGESQGSGFKTKAQAKKAALEDLGSILAVRKYLDEMIG